MTKKSGSIKIDKHHTFEYYLMGIKCPEIFGYVYIEGQFGGKVPGTTGFYRTDDPHEAARLACEKMRSEGYKIGE